MVQWCLVNRIDTSYSFSGYRGPTSNKRHIRDKGFRGLYRNCDGTIVNADLNGSANIGRKCYPDLFRPQNVNLRDVIIYTHPDSMVM